MDKTLEETKKNWKEYFSMEERLKMLFEQNVKNGSLILPLYEKDKNKIPLSEKEKALVTKKLRESEIISKRVDTLLAKMECVADKLGFNDIEYTSLN